MNPTYKELIAMEKYRKGDTGRIYSDKHRNNWIKAIISIFAIAMLLGMMGVPVYNGVVALEDNAIPYQLGNSVEASTATGGHMGDLVYYELLHWGALPSSNSLANIIRGEFESAGLAWLGEYAGMFATYILAVILSGRGITTGTILDALTSALSVIGIGLGTGGTVLVVVAGLIAAA